MMQDRRPGMSQQMHDPRRLVNGNELTCADDLSHGGYPENRAAGGKGQIGTGSAEPIVLPVFT